MSRVVSALDRYRSNVPTRSTPVDSSYNARHLLVLEGLEAVRKRPGMYIGSTDTRGLMQCLWEIIDNGVDEALGGFCTSIDVILHADGSAEVADNGRGIPVDKEPKTGLTGVEVVYTRLHAGGKFGGGSYVATGGLHGVGASVVNALSSRLDVEVDRAPATWAMSFRRGAPGVFASAAPDAAFKEQSGLGEDRPGQEGRHRHPGAVLARPADLHQGRALRLRRAGHAGPADVVHRARACKISIRDERGDEVVEESFKHDGGIGEFCEYLASDEPVTGVLRLQGVDNFTETVPVLDDAGHMTPQDVERELGVDIALRWGTGYDTELRSFVNVIATHKGGTHVSGFERALDQDVQRGDPADPADEGRRARCDQGRRTRGHDGRRDGPAGRAAVRGSDQGGPRHPGGDADRRRRSWRGRWAPFLSSNKKLEKPQARAVMEKVVNAARTRLAARAQRDTQRRKNALESSALPAKLADCRSNDVDRSELFIVEGDSALGTAKLARDSEYQALLPIRGKILNTQKKSSGEMLQNAECSSIIQVVGAGSGRTFDIDQTRYGKIIFMADADTDGAHIRCLLATLFHKHMRPLLEAGRIYSAVPPLHRIELSNPKKGMDKYVYTYTDDELQRKLAELTKKGVRWKDPVQRYKGLGEMDAHQLAETTMDPRRRTCAGSPSTRAPRPRGAEQVFEMLMGNDVAPRKEFIVQGAYEVDADAIDA